MDTNDVRMPPALRITPKRWSVPARTFAQRAIRDAQAAAAHAERGTKSRRDAGTLCYAAELTLEDADQNLRREKRPAPRARRTVAQAHAYVEAVCARRRL